MKGCRGLRFIISVSYALISSTFPCFAMENKSSISQPSYIPADCWEKYRASWYTVPAEAESNFVFHAQIGQIVANTKLIKNPDKPDNIAAFGLTIRSAENGMIVVEETILPFISSSIDQMKDSMIASDNSRIVTIRDLLGEDILHGQERTHKVLAMAEWLNVMKYTCGWNLDKVIEYDKNLIKNKDTKQLNVLKPIKSEESKAVGDILHCEQVVIYELLTDSRFLSDIITRLLDKLQNQSLPTKVCLGFNIITFNDMCSKCFSTLFYRFEEIKLKISDQFLSYFQKINKTDELSHKFPLIFRILVSSYRPYKIEIDRNTSLKTRQCKKCGSINSSCPLIETLLAAHLPLIS